MPNTRRSPFTCSVLFALLAVAACFPMHSEAQVLRCIDPANGQVSYTDGQCLKGHSTTEIVPQRSTDEVVRDEELARTARERWDAEQKAAATAPAPAPIQSGQTDADRRKASCDAARGALHNLTSNKESSPTAIDAAQRNMEMQCLGPEAYAALERIRANALAPNESTVIMPPPPLMQPPHAVPRPPKEAEQKLNCNVFRCQDQYGRTTPAPRPGG